MPGVVPPVGQLIGEEGTSLTRRPTLNFIGATVTAADNSASNRTDVTITSTGSSGAAYVLTPSGGDDSTQFQAALTAVAAAGGGEIVIDGMLLIGSACTYAGNGLILRGTSRIKSGLKATAATITPLTIGDNTTNFSGRHRISDLRFYASITKTAGAALSVNAGGTECHITHCQFLDHYDGITITGGAQNVHVTSNEFFGFTRDAVSINYSTAAERGTMGYGTTAWIVDNMFCGVGFVLTAGASSAGVHVKSGDGITIRGNAFVQFGYNIRYDPVRDHAPETGLHVIDGNILSDSLGYGLYINGGSFQVSKLLVTNNIICYTLLGSGGALITGANANGVRFLGNEINQNTTGAGLTVGSGVTNLAVHDNLIHGNANYGIDIASGVVGFSIQGNRITNSNLGAGVTASQTYGIRYGGSHSDSIVLGNDLRGNATAGTTGTAPSSNSYVAGNIS